MSKARGTGLALIGVGSILSSMVLAGLILGYVLDKWLNTLPLFMFILGCLGFVGGLLKAYKLLSRPDKQ
ncbi:MAG: AtpZ/AtpI family protein [Gammaproteobacteria bacterium]